MPRNDLKSGDQRNLGFGAGGKVVDHKPGIDYGPPPREHDAAGNHRFRRSDQKDIPQGSLADRIVKSRKG